MSEYMRTLARRAQRWSVAFKSNNYKKNKTLKRFVRKGIPIDLRTNCWMEISGAEKIKNESVLSYNQLRHQYSNQIVESIQIDLPRTFPDNVFFANQEALCTMLYNVLAVFSQQNLDVGYCQGLNYIAGSICSHFNFVQLTIKNVF